MLIIFFDINGIAHKEFVPAGQTVNSAYYCAILWRVSENVRRLHPNFGGKKKNWLLHHDNASSHTSFITGEFFNKNNMTVPSTYFSVSPIEDKTERPPF
jgi:hypothetical protein